MSEMVIVGTRGSPLALWQANWVKGKLERLHPGLIVNLKTIKTQGDQLLQAPFSEIGGKGLFVNEIELALRNGDVDIAVHSLKDLPTEQPEGLTITAVPPRADPRDAFVSRRQLRLVDLPTGARVGTSSPRRAAQLLAFRGDLQIVSVRGNVETRLRKGMTDLDGVVLALAGLRRLNLADLITEIIPPEVCVPAVGQGALAVEAREDDRRIAGLLGGLDDPEARMAVMAERAFLSRLGGGCQVPIGANGRIAAGTFRLIGVVADPSGRPCLREEVHGAAGGAVELAIGLAERLLAKGAGELLGLPG
ncbi:MAG: hydroxymethylbilane synthase [Dehalococcoidales bacterium]|nr:hydroxymethylbilane synthase [Dehalococcoidales bacterium]